MAALPLSVQLYTLRDLTAKDMAGTLLEVAKIGYRYVEMGGWGNLKSAAEARKALDAAGLKVSGAHVPLESMESDLKKAMNEQETIGNKILIVPWLAEERRKDAAGWKKVGQSLSKIAAEAQKRSFQIAYHNHDFEFKPIDGTNGLDLLFGASDPNLVKAELDVYWVKRGGEDPVACINKLANRLLLVHLKDLAPEGNKFAAVGAGTLDFKAILAASIKAGATFGVVEQDDCYGASPLANIRTSYENLKKLGVE